MTTAVHPVAWRLTLVAADTAADSAVFARDVRVGLLTIPKYLPCRYFYDRAGALLFEQICRLPEYYLTRAEGRILEERAAEIAACWSNGATLVELGSGSSRKTRILIKAFLHRNEPLRYVSVDVSRETLEENSIALLADFRDLEITAFAGEYRDGLRFIQRAVEGPKCFLWLGSSIGNFDRAEAGAFLRHLGDTMSPKDGLLVGIDLRKDRDELERAYDDPRGVTARFNKNILAHINRELGGRFQLQRFRHRARYDDVAGRIEIHLLSTVPHKVRIDQLDLTVAFGAGESIHTESSYKYSRAEIEQLARAGNLRMQHQWLDAENRFSVNLFRPLHT